MEKKSTELSIGGAAPLPEIFDDSYQYEMSTEREPREVMNERSDRAELSDLWVRPAVELQ